MNRCKRELINPIFLECKEKVDKDFWKSVFDEFAYGKYPKQLYITNYQIQSTNRNNFFQYNYKNKTIEEMIPEIQELLLKHTNLISNEDMNKKKNNLNKFKENVFTNWKNIKKKFIKSILVMNYCIELKKIYQLPQSVTNKLYNKLFNYIILGYVQHINMENNKIHSIEGLVVTNENIMFNFPDKEIEENLYEFPDFINNYCKRYLLRTAKHMKDT